MLLRSKMILLKSSRCFFKGLLSSINKAYKHFLRYNLFASDFFKYKSSRLSQTALADFSSVTPQSTSSPRLNKIALWALCVTYAHLRSSIFVIASSESAASKPWWKSNTFIFTHHRLKSFVSLTNFSISILVRAMVLFLHFLRISTLIPLIKNQGDELVIKTKKIGNKKELCYFISIKIKLMYMW